jgi:hypothetical protein
MAGYSSDVRYQGLYLEDECGELYDSHIVLNNKPLLVQFWKKYNYAFVPETAFLDDVPYEVPLLPGKICQQTRIKLLRQSHAETQRAIAHTKIIPYQHDFDYNQLSDDQKKVVSSVIAIHNDESFLNTEFAKQDMAMLAVLDQQFVNLVCKAGLGNLQFTTKDGNFLSKPQYMSMTPISVRAKSTVINLIFWMIRIYTHRNFKFEHGSCKGRNGLASKTYYSTGNLSFTQEEKNRFDAILQHFISISEEIPISIIHTINLTKISNDLRKKRCDSCYRQLYRIHETHAISPRFLGQQYLNDNATLGREWSFNSTLLTSCIIFNRLFQHRPPHANKEKTKLIYTNLPKDLNYITQKESKMVHRHYNQLCGPHTKVYTRNNNKNKHNTSRLSLDKSFSSIKGFIYSDEED